MTIDPEAATKFQFMVMSGPPECWASENWIVTKELPVVGQTYGFRCTEVYDKDGMIHAVMALCPLVVGK